MMMPTEAADRAREEAEDRAERNHIEPDAETLADALTDISDRLIAGKTVDGWTMADIFDCWLDDTPNREACKKLAACLNVFAENGSASAFWLNALQWQHELVRRISPPRRCASGPRKWRGTLRRIGGERQRRLPHPDSRSGGVLDLRRNRSRCAVGSVRMKKMWHTNDRVLMPTGRPGIIERIYRERGTDLHRMEVRYTDTLKLDVVDVRVDLPRIKEQRGF